VQHLIIALATTPSPAPSPSLRPGLSEDQVTPGTWGFILTAFIVVLTTLLIVDMVRRIRRVRYRAQVEEARLAAQDLTAQEPSAQGGSAQGQDFGAGEGSYPAGHPDPSEGDGDAAPRRT
jgi:hypothetical protein